MRTRMSRTSQCARSAPGGVRRCRRTCSTVSTAPPARGVQPGRSPAAQASSARAYAGRQPTASEADAGSIRHPGANSRGDPLGCRCALSSPERLAACVDDTDRSLLRRHVQSNIPWSAQLVQADVVIPPAYRGSVLARKLSSSQVDGGGASADPTLAGAQ